MIGTSWGGLDALSRLLDGLHDDVHQPIVVAQHRLAGSEDITLGRLLQLHTRRLVSDPDDKTPLENDHVYIGPPDYHVLVEEGLLVLSTDAPVQFARPSIDVLFVSAADAYGDRVYRHRAHGCERRRSPGSRARSRSAAVWRSCRTLPRRRGGRCPTRRSR